MHPEANDPSHQTDPHAPHAAETGQAAASESQTQAEAQPQAAAAADEASPPATASPPEKTMADQLAEREDQLMRLAAEVDNLRKRHAQELANASKFAIESFAEALLSVADSLETALRLQDQTQENFRAGVELTLKQLQNAFDKGRLVSLDPSLEKFDPNRHQAVSMVDGASQTPAVASGHVVAVMQKGYLIGERVLRPALVVVAQ